MRYHVPRRWSASSRALCCNCAITAAFGVGLGVNTDAAAASICTAKRPSTVSGAAGGAAWTALGAERAGACASDGHRNGGGVHQRESCRETREHPPSDAGADILLAAAVERRLRTVHVTQPRADPLRHDCRRRASAAARSRSRCRASRPRWRARGSSPCRPGRCRRPRRRSHRRADRCDRSARSPAKIWMPFGNCVRPGAAGSVVAAASEATSLFATRSSCSPSLNGLQIVIGSASGPLAVPKMPSGKYGRARLPIARLLYAMPFASAVGSFEESARRGHVRGDRRRCRRRGRIGCRRAATTAAPPRSDS